MPSIVGHFPPEILSAFFVLVKRLASSQHHRSGVARVDAEIRSLVKLSGVCRHWRLAILDDGTLWTDVVVDTARPGCERLLRSVLKRSKLSTVSVTASVLSSATNQETIGEVMKIITEASGRIGDLILDTDSTSFLEGWTFPTPVLRKLRLNNRGPCAPLTTMFTGQTSQLESLTLSGFIGCPAVFLGNLKHLALKLPPTHPPVLTTAVVDLLTAAPNIETLSLTSFLFVIDNSSPSLKATLPRLRNAMLRKCDTASILPHIVIPKGAELRISVDHRTLGSGTDLPSADHHILLALPPSLEAHLYLPASPKIIIEIGETLGGFAIALSNVDSTDLCLKISDCSGRVPLDFVRRSLEAIPRHTFFKTARNVTISIPPIVPGILWSPWLKNFTLATQLSVRALPAEVVLDALMRTDGDGLPVCPCLKRVGFHGTGSSVVLMDPKSITKLFLFRAATGFSLEKVKVVECGMVKDFTPPAWLGDLLGGGTDKLH
jgi:hypothetical protein